MYKSFRYEFYAKLLLNLIFDGNESFLKYNKGLLLLI